LATQVETHGFKTMTKTPLTDPATTSAIKQQNQCQTIQPTPAPELDPFFAGTNTCFVDAAFPLAQPNNAPRRAGIGVLICNNSGPIMPAVKVQASTKEVIISPLHAEALAMLLASRLTRALNYHQVTYKSDNQILVSTYRLVLVAGTPEALPLEH
jgi:hypothetical protein